MELEINQKVNHSKYGIGTVISVHERYYWIEFNNEEIMVHKQGVKRFIEIIK